jgi:hypothetical protein
LNADGVTALLDVMDALAIVHPGFADKEQEYGRLSDAEREAAYDGARRLNEANAELRSAIEVLLETETYRIYFRRFTNITAEQLRDLLLDLPYRKRSAPGDVGSTLFDLFRRRDTIRTALDRLLIQADIERVYETALRFAPGSRGELPTMHLIYDSNAGSFAAEGLPFFNVYTGIDLAALAESANAASLRDAERTMAHELQHVLAKSTLYPKTEEERSWREEWIDQMTRGTVGEGVAMLCNPPSGSLREVYADPDVLGKLAERYNELLRALRSDKLTEEDVRTWYRDNYYDFAIGLLREHLAKRYSGAELETEVKASMRYRPDFEHAFGWWMVSRIWARDPRREVVAGLLENPFFVYRLYNETIDDEQRHLRIDIPAPG